MMISIALSHRALHRHRQGAAAAMARCRVWCARYNTVRCAYREESVVITGCGRRGNEK